MTEQRPLHIGFILDGNRRWAQTQGLPTLKGHAAGAKKAQEIVEYAYKSGIGIISMYGFSVENWKRNDTEVNYLMDLFTKFIDSNIEEFHQKGIKLVHLGRLEGLPDKLAQKIKQAVEKTKNNQKLIFQLALNYSGREEIIRACQRMIETKQPITIENFNNNLDSQGNADPDLIIRTSGEQRLSGFLPWQSTYSELFFTKTSWPDFSIKELEQILQDFKSRDRRFGGNSSLK